MKAPVLEHPKNSIEDKKVSRVKFLMMIFYSGNIQLSCSARTIKILKHSDFYLRPTNYSGFLEKIKPSQSLKEIVNVVPSPGLLSTAICPPKLVTWLYTR